MKKGSLLIVGVASALLLAGCNVTFSNADADKMEQRIAELEQQIEQLEQEAKSNALQSLTPESTPSEEVPPTEPETTPEEDRKSTRLNSSH